MIINTHFPRKPHEIWRLKNVRCIIRSCENIANLGNSTTDLPRRMLSLWVVDDEKRNNWGLVRGDVIIDATANTVFRRKESDFAQDCACAEWILLWHVRQTHSGFHRHYNYTAVPKIPDFTLKKAQVSWMCFIILNDLYAPHIIIR